MLYASWLLVSIYCFQAAGARAAYGTRDVVGMGVLFLATLEEEASQWSRSRHLEEADDAAPKSLRFLVKLLPAERGRRNCQQSFSTILWYQVRDNCT